MHVTKKHGFLEVKFEESPEPSESFVLVSVDEFVSDNSSVVSVFLFYINAIAHGHASSVASWEAALLQKMFNEIRHWSRHLIQMMDSDFFWMCNAYFLCPDYFFITQLTSMLERNVLLMSQPPCGEWQDRVDSEDDEEFSDQMNG